MSKIKFKDLSIWLKVGIVGGIGFAFYFTIMFLIGFIEGAAGL